jgi:DNA mismatch endonuclease, patch repair protein
MVDVHTPRQRSFNMSRIKGKDTKPELLIRKGLYRRGFRYRLHVKGLPGKPDIVFTKYKAVVFINGCFWHYHDCYLFKMPATRQEWWQNKLEKTHQKDRGNINNLLMAGWRVLVVWECSFRKTKKIESKKIIEVVEQIEEWLFSGTDYKELEGKH